MSLEPAPPSRELLPVLLATRLENRAAPSASVAANVSAPDAEDLPTSLARAADDLGAARLSDAIYETFRLQAVDIPRRGTAPDQSLCNQRRWPLSRPRNRPTARNCLLPCCATASCPMPNSKTVDLCG